MATSITIHCAAREYYTGQDTYILPFDLGLEHIDSVQPDGYGEALIFLNEEGDAVINDQDLDFDGESYYKHVDMAVHHDWLILKFQNQFGLKFRGDMHMEFLEVDENFVDHWECEDVED